MAALSVLALALVASGASAAPAKGAAHRVILLPKPNQLVAGNVAGVAIRGTGLRIFLNRHRISPRELRRAHHGVGRLRASISQGLQSGPQRAPGRSQAQGPARPSLVDRPLSGQLPGSADRRRDRPERRDRRIGGARGCRENRMFEPVPNDDDPRAEGLGISPEEFLAHQEWKLWSPNNGVQPPEDACVWR